MYAGPVYVYATGSKQHLYVSDPKLLKELKLQNYMDLGVPRYLSKPFQPLIGDSIIRANGQDFAYQKKVIAPEFFLNKVKVICSQSILIPYPIVYNYVRISLSHHVLHIGYGMSDGGICCGFY